MAKDVLFYGLGNSNIWFLKTKNKDGTVTITGSCHDVEVGDIIRLSSMLGEHDYNYEVKEVKRRKAQGNYPTTTTTDNLYFSAICIPTKTIFSI